MSHPVFSTEVRERMRAPVHTARASQGLREVEHELSLLDISALPIVDDFGKLMGVLSRTDLVRAGQARDTDHERRRVLNLPDVSAQQLMTRSVEVVGPATPLAEAARRMVRQHIHRLFVAEDRTPLGVISTKEMMSAVIDAKLSVPLHAVMHGSVVSVQAADPIALALERMTAAHHSSLVVLEDGFPVGMLTQRDALLARDVPPDRRVDQWMDARILCLPLEMPVFRAAEQALATRARCVLAVDASGVRGIVTGMDFAKLLYAEH